MLVALIPAHNEQDCIRACIEGLQRQTRPPDRIFVVADNCTDDTVQISRRAGATVFTTRGNTHKKAGALNQVLRRRLPELADGDVVLVTDADSVLNEHFIEAGLEHLEATHPDDIVNDDGPQHGVYGGVGGIFEGTPGGGLVGFLQRNEYARYARDVRRLKGLCLVITGTAALFRAGTLKRISEARLSGELPAGDGQGGVYDTTVLTEDNELTFAILHLGWKVISPQQCTLVTEVMPTWKDLWRQRLRWKRGAIENCVQYGLTDITWRYWGRQALSLIGVLVTAIYLVTLVWSATVGEFQIRPFWALVTLVFVAERIITVRDRGPKIMLASATMFELIYDFFLQACHAKAFADAFLRRERRW